MPKPMIWSRCWTLGVAMAAGACSSNASNTDTDAADNCQGDGACDGGQARDSFVEPLDDDRQDPHGCDATPHPDTIEPRSTSDGVDLVIVEYSACDCCEGCTVSIRIANVGATALETGVHVGLFASEGDYEEAKAGNPDVQATIFEFAGPLASGRVSQPVARHVDLGRNAMRHGYYLVVDPEDAIAESDETNNGVTADGSNIAVCF